ncbi:MAG: hypothetical protein OHK006_03930 [Thermodesulfovibrionales bacterium]
MDLPRFAVEIISLAKRNPLPAAAVGLALAYIVWRNTRRVVSLVILAVILAGVWYFIMHLASIGGEQKGKMLEKGEKQIEQVR